MKQISIFTFFIVLFLFIACKDSSKKNIDYKEKKTFSLLYLEQYRINIFSQKYVLDELQHTLLKSFYTKKNNSFVWVNDLGINEHAKNFIATLNAEKIHSKTDSIIQKKNLYNLYNTFIEKGYKFNSTDTVNIEFELLLTTNFFEYAKRNWQVLSKEKLKKTGWNITRNNLNEDDRLDAFLKNDVIKNPSFEPVYHQFELLKKQLKKYSDIEKRGGWTTSYSKNKTFKKGDSSLEISFLKKELYFLEDLSVNDNTNLFNDALEIAVKNFQNRFGLLEDGIIAGKTMQEMCIPVQKRMQQLAINIERCKWMPIEQKGDYLAVNIPSFKLLVYHSDSLDWSCKVVVGKSKVSSNTVVFNDSLESVVFSPYWNLPTSILMKETLPAIRKNSNYLVNHNMEIIDDNTQPIALSKIKGWQFGKKFPYNIRQKPGKNNSLGLVKFLFPNEYNIYLHDTPEKSLFEESSRMFSHGCVRLEEPVKLAKFLLREDKSWTDEKMKQLMNGERETVVKLKRKVPVYIAYFTTWVNRNGQLNFRKDVYNHDEKMRRILF